MSTNTRSSWDHKELICFIIDIKFQPLGVSKEKIRVSSKSERTNHFDGLEIWVFLVSRVVGTLLLLVDAGKSLLHGW